MRINDALPHFVHGGRWKRVADEQIYYLSLKGKKDQHTVVGTSIDDAGGFVIIKNDKREIVGRFKKAEVQGYSQKPLKG
jgi:hypothetical protein